MNIIGRWIGYYEYGVGYSLPHFGKRVKIEVILKGDNEIFFGTVLEEESEYAVPLKGKITGFSEDNIISFIKSYPQTPLLKEEGNTEIIMKKGVFNIEHEGIIDAENKSMYGSWSIYTTETDEEGSYEYNSYGIWLLKSTK